MSARLLKHNQWAISGGENACHCLYFHRVCVSEIENICSGKASWYHAGIKHHWLSEWNQMLSNASNGGLQQVAPPPVFKELICNRMKRLPPFIPDLNHYLLGVDRFFLHAGVWNKPSEYLISPDQISILKVTRGEYNKRYPPHFPVFGREWQPQFGSTVTPGVAWDMWLLKGAPQDNDGSWEGANFVFRWWVFSLSTGGPLCSILHHCKASVQVADLSARLSRCTMEWQKRSHYQGHFSFCSRTMEHLFQIRLKQHKRGSRAECSKYLCCSPKINNVPSYTTRLSSALWIWMESSGKKKPAALRLRWQLQSADGAYY